jgi:hypothetical protein
MQRILATLSAGSVRLLLALMLCAQLAALHAPAVAADGAEVAFEADAAIDDDPTRPTPQPRVAAVAIVPTASTTRAPFPRAVVRDVPAAWLPVGSATGPPA